MYEVDHSGANFVLLMVFEIGLEVVCLVVEVGVMAYRKVRDHRSVCDSSSDSIRKCRHGIWPVNVG